jgi:peptidoglycan hydrolase-like protein with peptidoglycan-binding domain
MKRIAGPVNLSINLLTVTLLIVAVPAAAQLEIGGQPFQGDESETTTPASGDQLTQRIQRDLVALGYDPGSINGEMTVDTAVAISKFQAENGMDVSGEASPQLAGILAARVGAMRGDNAQVQATARAANTSPNTAEATETCRPRAVQSTAESSDTSGRLARAGGRLFSRFGNREAKEQLAEVAATASDVAEVADIVGDLTECEP